MRRASSVWNGFLYSAARRLAIGEEPILVGPDEAAEFFRFQEYRSRLANLLDRAITNRVHQMDQNQKEQK